MILDEKGVVQKAYDYYPFGLQLRAYQPGDPATFTFTNKQLDQDGGLDWYYFGARFYDAEVGRFLGVDPLAGKYPALNPYHYTKNNPLKYVDRDGMQTEGDEEDQLEQEYIMWVNFGKASKQAIQELPQSLNFSEAAKEITNAANKSVIGISDATSDVSTAGALTGVGLTVLGSITKQPGMIKTGIEIAGKSLAAGIRADGVSLVSKIVDYGAFDGSGTDVGQQSLKFTSSIGAGALTKPLQIATRTSFATGVVFRNKSTGRFITNKAGGFATAKADAVKVIIPNVIRD